MARRIFQNTVLIVVFAVLLTAAIILPSLYNVHETNIRRELQQEVDCLVRALELTHEDVAYLSGLNTTSRVTLIAPDGTVLFDNRAEESRMGNHAGRPEVIGALTSGSGESVRTSDTLAETTLYYAMRTDEGSVLRISSTRKSMLGTFLNVLPMIIGMLLCLVVAALLIARGTARRIVAPLNALNLDQPLENNAYDELAPLLSRMHSQHMQIHRHVQALENARAELAAVMENMREGMILLDRNDTVLSMNESAGRIFGVNAEQAVGKNLFSSSRDADLYELVKAALGGEGGNFIMRRGDRHYRIFANPVLKDAAVRGAVLLALDVTERFAAEESRREFTANVSHELKTPLTSISGFAEIIRDGIAKPQDVQHFAGMICKESARLIDLVNDILELSRLDEKQNPGRKETVPLMPMLCALADDFDIAARKKNLKLRLSGSEAQVDGYPRLLREMFFNLIDNAIKYTPDGGEIQIKLERSETHVICSVTDNGIGIPPEHQPHIFERFYRVDKSHSRQTGGTGLGLAIVKHVASTHEAALELNSAANAGTTFRVLFPVG